MGFICSLCPGYARSLLPRLLIDGNVLLPRTRWICSAGGVQRSDLRQRVSFCTPLSSSSAGVSCFSTSTCLGAASRVSKDSTTESDAGPLQYSSSEAARWKARHSFGVGPGDDSPWYQPAVVLISIGAFLIYFCVLREENDLDERMCLPLVDQVPGLERSSLEVYVAHGINNGLDVSKEAERLRELRLIDAKKNK